MWYKIYPKLIVTMWEHGCTDFIGIEEIADSIVKPNRTTAIHCYLFTLQDVFEIESTLEEVNLNPKFPKPKFDKCTKYGHFECDCLEVIEQWIEYVKKPMSILIT